MAIRDTARLSTKFQISIPKSVRTAQRWHAGQAYLMHTDPRFFTARAVGIAQDRLTLLQAQFLLSMPPGWLRDCTKMPILQ